MQEKWFFQDKNYLLKETQAALQPELLHHLVREAGLFYISHFNRLGFSDPVIDQINHTVDYSLDNFEEFYQMLAAYYRWQYGEVQLEFLFDGSSHEEKYKAEWKMSFMQWIRDFFHQHHFLMTVIKAGIFEPKPFEQQLIRRRLKYFLEQQFGVKVYRYREIRQIA